jgi:hypothetical protein
MILAGKDQADKARATQADADPGCAAVTDATDGPQAD